MEILQLITEFDKFIYNTYLRVSRSNNKLPFKIRKDFEKLDDKSFVSIKKISSFLKRFPHIKVEDFFRAPFALYTDEKYFPLEFFLSLKATKAYTLFNKRQENLDPDSDEQLNNIKKSIVFINQFCRKQGINPLFYIDHKTNNEFSFILHLREHNVCVYPLLNYKNFERNLRSRDTEVVKYIIGEDLYNNIQLFRTRLYNSKKAIKLVDLGLKKITNNT
jgi:hypothetical protein